MWPGRAIGYRGLHGRPDTRDAKPSFRVRAKTSLAGNAVAPVDACANVVRLDVDLVVQCDLIAGLAAQAPVALGRFDDGDLDVVGLDAARFLDVGEDQADELFLGFDGAADIEISMIV